MVGVPLYALVSVDWATEVTTTESDGRAWTVFAKGQLGTPKGTTWYLHPAEHRAELDVHATR